MKIRVDHDPMKKSIRPLFIITILIAFGIGLSCRTAVRLNLRSWAPETGVLTVKPAVFNEILFPVPENGTREFQPAVFNEALLALATEEIGETERNLEIDRLLQMNFKQRRSRYPSTFTWRRDIHNFRTHRSRSANRDIRKRYPEKSPFFLLNPKYTRFLPEFRNSLRNWSVNKRFRSEIMPDLIELVKRPINHHLGFEDSNRSYSSCAVVGNSGILLEKEHGELIDSHEVVIRLNNAQIYGYQKHVGSKTTISFMNSNILHLCALREGCYCHPYGENVPIVMYICQAVHFMDYVVCNFSHKAPLLITDSRFDMLCMRIVKYYSLQRFMETTGKHVGEWADAHEGSFFHYSSGMQAIMLALGMCDKVSIFGFGKSIEAKHHYHTDQKGELHLHDYEAEYMFYHDLIYRPHFIPFIKDYGFVVPHVSIYQ